MEFGTVIDMEEEKMEEKEKAMAMSPAPTATIKLDGWWNHPERHGAMFDLAASEDVKLREGEVKVIPLGIRMKLPEGYFGLVVPRSSTCLRYGIMMANSVGIIEPDYCGPNDVWGFVAYATRGTNILKGTRIAQFMPVRMFGDLDFDVVESMPYTDRGGYGSTGERSAGKPVYRDMNGDELHVGDFVTDELMDCYCVMGLNISDGDAYADIGNGNASVKVALCRDLELDQRPHDCDGVPIEVGDVVYRVRDDNGEHYDSRALIVDGFFGDGYVHYDTSNDRAGSWRACGLTHREPDSFELIAREMGMDEYDYCAEYRLDYGGDGDPAEFSMRAGLVRRMKAVAARG